MLYGGSRGKRSGRFCGADWAMLMELAHGFEMNRAEIPSCTANSFNLYLHDAGLFVIDLVPTT